MFCHFHEINENIRVKCPITTVTALDITPMDTVQINRMCDVVVAIVSYMYASHVHVPNIENLRYKLE